MQSKLKSEMKRNSERNVKGRWGDILTFVGGYNEMITRRLVFQSRKVDPPAFHITTIADPEDSPLRWNDNSCL